MNYQPNVYERAAATALIAARDRDYDTAIDAVNVLADAEMKQIISIVLAWIDTVISVLNISVDGFVGVRWRHEASGEITDADSTPPHIVWAGRMFAARVSDDMDQFLALIGSIGDAEQWGDCVMGVLEVCAASLRNGASVLRKRP